VVPAESLQMGVVAWFLSWPEWTVPVAKLFSQLGDEHFYLLLLPLLLWFGRWTQGLAAGRSVVLCDLLSEWIKWTFAMPRPPAQWALASEISPGFVSSHAALSMTLAVSLWRDQRKLRPFLLVWVLGVAWSRLRLAVHFPLDILGGWVLGLGIALLLKRLGRDRRSSFVVLGIAILFSALWAPEGGASWQRDLGLLLGLELTVIGRYWGKSDHSPPPQMGKLQGFLRLLLLLAAYVGLKSLAWPRLLRYLVVGVVAGYRGRAKG
jgi:PAP2 superfamily protein